MCVCLYIHIRIYCGRYLNAFNGAAATTFFWSWRCQRRCCWSPIAWRLRAMEMEMEETKAKGTGMGSLLTACIDVGELTAATATS